MTLTKIAETVREISLTDAIETFVSIDMQARAPETCKWYRRKLKALDDALGNRLLDELLETDLVTWYGLLAARPLSIYTLHGYVRAARRLFRWLHVRHYVAINLAENLRLPKLPRRGRAGIADQNVVSILEAAFDHPRDYAILTFIESTGCRRAGVAGLRLSDLDLDAPEPVCRRARVIEKGDKERTVRMSPEALAAMRRWMADRKSGTDFVFVDERPHRDRGLEPGAITLMIARYKKRLGIKGKVSPHQWRHRWCRRLSLSGMPLGLVSQGAGHGSVQVTNDFYGVFTSEEVLSSVDRYYSPSVERLSKKTG